MRVLSFGEILFDIIEGVHYLGGAPLNFAGHLAQMGVETSILSAVGDDALGKRALEEVAALGVNTSLVQVKKDFPTGTVPVSFQQGQPDYTILENVAYDYIDFPKTALATAAPFDVLYFGTLAQRNSLSQATLRKVQAQHSFKQVFYDINLRKGCVDKQIIDDSLGLCTILKLNDEEVSMLSELFYQEMLSPEAFARRAARQWSIQVIVITAGAAGSYVLEEDTFGFATGYPATVVDTVGAGDSFSAAFVLQYLKNKLPLRAADIANRLGAFVASSRGPLPAYTADIKKALEL